ncbi:molybdenum cofactor biosynthesis protein MoaE [Arthrobacter sp. ISL-30]|nr:molybdenum cofactor biosynthesis protein MoaE [Arthrobacter sp. ISL-30]
MGGKHANHDRLWRGLRRNHDGGKAVDRLSYTAHPAAHQVMDDVVAELQAKYAEGAQQPVRIWAAHRIGMLRIGDPALVCAVSAAHRGQAFAVCSELVDLIKARVPIWKEQFFSDGTVEWVGTGFARTASANNSNLSERKETQEIGER